MKAFKNQVTIPGDGTLLLEATPGIIDILEDTPEMRNVLKKRTFRLDTNHRYTITSGYDLNKGKKNTLFLHHFVLPQIPRVPDEPQIVVDHINQNRHDHRRANLRYMDKSGNSINAKLNKNNNSGITGLRRYEERSSWTIILYPVPTKQLQKAFHDADFGGDERLSRRAAIMHMNEMKSKIPRYIEAGWKPIPID